MITMCLMILLAISVLLFINKKTDNLRVRYDPNLYPSEITAPLYL